MFKLLYNYAHFTCKQGNAQNPSVSASAVYELRISIETRGQIANFLWIMEKAKEFQKNIYCCFFDYAKAFDCVKHNKLREMSLRDGNIRPPYLSPEKPLSRPRSNSWNLT